MVKLQPHIKCKKGDIAEIVLLPGDPGRVEKIIKYWDEAEKIAYNREFLIFTGKYKGIPISVCSTGVGCPGAAIAIEELINIGAKYFIRIGTCGGLQKQIKPGNIIIPTAAIRAEGTTAEYIDPLFPAVSDYEITLSLVEAAEKLNNKYFTGINRTHDAFYEHIENLSKWGKYLDDERMRNWPVPLVSSEMECSVIFLVSLLRGVKAGAVLSVNTIEPFEMIRDNPEEIYKLSETKDSINGVDKAIKVALKAVEILKEKGLL